ncbi:Lsr2 dimerization domain-containing protein [Nocardia jiangxiensis]|uniref:Histone-like nucleoid-structuring protein Lsr2 n=1 Tax=Nocardia jiangxiensis TaxID=282685 RepID=A0ABW6RT18_9NOCA|nr:histone-like nucleoid-structuring protein Lsr2 [Nocardia jiangxiensis]
MTTTGLSVADGTVEFSFEGVDYEIDLCEGNAEKLRAVLLP